MIFESDQNKAERNRQKHKVGFSEAESVFGSPVIFEDLIIPRRRIGMPQSDSARRGDC